MSKEIKELNTDDLIKQMKESGVTDYAIVKAIANKIEIDLERQARDNYFEPHEDQLEAHWAYTIEQSSSLPVWDRAAYVNRSMQFKIKEIKD